MPDESASVTIEHLTLTGPMRAVSTIDMQELLADGFLSWAHFWQQSGQCEFRWEGAGAVTRSNKMLWDVDTYAGAGLPDALATLRVMRGVPDERCGEVMRAIGELIYPLEVEEMELCLYDFGIASVTIQATQRADCPPLREEPASALKRVEQWSSQVCGDTGLMDWCRDALVACDDMLPSHFKAASLWKDAKGIWSPGDPGQILWMHRIPTLRMLEPHNWIDKDVGARIPVNSDERLEVARGDDVCVVIPAIGTSVLLAKTGSWSKVAKNFSNVVCLQNSYWAGSQELGSAILKDMNGLSRFRRQGNMKAVRSEAYQVIELHDRVSLFRSLMSEMVVRLPPLEFDLWERTARAWNLASVLSQTEMRQADLAQLGDRFLGRVQEDSALRLNGVLLILTVINGIGVIATLIDFLMQGKLGHPSIVRALVLVFSIVIVVAAVMVFNNGRELRRDSRTATGVAVEPSHRLRNRRK